MFSSSARSMALRPLRVLALTYEPYWRRSFTTCTTQTGNSKPFVVFFFFFFIFPFVCSHHNNSGKFPRRTDCICHVRVELTVNNSWNVSKLLNHSSLAGPTALWPFQFRSNLTKLRDNFLILYLSLIFFFFNY